MGITDNVQIQMNHEVAERLATIETKLDSIADRIKTKEDSILTLSSRVDELEHQKYYVMGAIAVIGLLISSFGIVANFYIDGRVRSSIDNTHYLGIVCEEYRATHKHDAEVPRLCQY